MIGVFTENELNNMVYIGLKWVCGRTIEVDGKTVLVEPPNEEIDLVLFKVGPDSSLDEIAEAVIQHARSRAGMTNIDYDTSGKRRLLLKYLSEFITLPDGIRNNLGEDADYTKLVTRH